MCTPVSSPLSVEECRPEHSSYNLESDHDHLNGRAIFEDWFLNHFRSSVQCYLASKNCDHKAVLFLDYCCSQPVSVCDLQGNMSDTFPQYGMTSLIQPMVQDVMYCFKLDYFELTFADLHQPVVCNAE